MTNENVRTIIEEYLHGISSETLTLITEEICELNDEVNWESREVETDLLKEILKYIIQLKRICSTIEPQSTEDILDVNDLNVIEYKLEVIINKLK